MDINFFGFLEPHIKQCHHKQVSREVYPIQTQANTIVKDTPRQKVVEKEKWLETNFSAH